MVAWRVWKLPSPRRSVASRACSGGFAPEDPYAGDHEALHERPADEGDDRGDVQNRAGGGQCIRMEDALERRHEDTADIGDDRYESVRRTGIEQEKHDAHNDERLNDPGHEDRHAAGVLAVARS